MNLATHAVFNPSIYLSGSKLEMIERLRGILEMRLADRQGNCLEIQMLWGG